MGEWLSIVAAIAFMIGFPVMLVRGIRDMKHDRSTGSFIASSMIEMDRLIRPSSEYVVQAEDETQQHEDGIGGE